MAVASSRADAWLDRVSAETGLHDFGPSEFKEPLDTFLRQMDEAPLSEAGRVAHFETVRRWLANRAGFARDLARHAEIRAEDVSDPIVILGFPRSGTTLLQRMMSADPAVQALWTWRAINPAPLPDERPSAPTERIAFARSVERQLRAGNPDFYAAHPILAEDAEEDSYLHNLSFQHVGNFVFLPTTSYLAYLRTLPRLPTYRYAADLLRYLQWQDGGRRGRPWILKSPIHLGCLDELIEVHPNATLIYPRRDPATIIASFCHLLEVVSRPGFPSLDPRSIGTLSMEFWREELHRFQACRRRLGSRLRLIEIPYRQLLAEPIPWVRSVHRAAGRDLSTLGENAIRSWIARQPAHHHRQETYSLERYGLCAETVTSAIAELENAT